MSRGKELTKNTLILTIGRMCTQGISFLLLPLYTAKLSTEQYGIVDLLTTYVTLLTPIIIFEIQQAIFRYLIDKREKEEEKKMLISTTFIATGIQTAIFLLVFTIIAQFIENEYKYFLATNVVAMIFSSIMLQISRGLGNTKAYAFGSFVTGTTTIILNVIFIVGFNWGAYGMLAASGIANVICAIYILLKLRLYKYISFRSFNMNKLKEMWKYSVPLIPNSISWWIMGVSDRTIITATLGVSANGIYSAANKVSSIFNTIYNIFSLTWTESASLHIKDPDAEVYFSKMINRIFKLFATICFGIIGCIPYIFNLLINENFAEAYMQIPILILATLCNVMVTLLSGLYIANKMTKVVMYTSIISATINIIVNVSLINLIGLYAASISTFIAYFLMMAIRMINIKKYFNIKYNKKDFVQIFVMAIIVIILYYIKLPITNLVLLILVILYAIIANRELITFFKELNLIEMITKKINKQ